MKKISTGVLMLLIVLGGVPLVTHGQTVEEVFSYETSVNENDFDFEVTPDNPGPFQSVTIRVSSNLVDANRYPITWTVDGQTISQGIGKRSITIQTKNYGESVTILMSIQLIDSIVRKEIVLAPQDSTILWEAIDSYVPPFYKGKKLPAREAIVRITSIPNFLSNKTSSGTKHAVYNWTRNDKVVADGSGYGKDSLTIQHNRVRQNEVIGVTSSSVNGNARSTSSITLSFFEPRILFYEQNTASGILSRFSQTLFSLDQQSLTLAIVPYFFSTINGNPDMLSFNWKMNNRTISTPARSKTLLTLTKPEGSGSAALSLSISHPSLVFQTAAREASVVFRP